MNMEEKYLQNKISRPPFYDSDIIYVFKEDNSFYKLLPNEGWF